MLFCSAILVVDSVVKSPYIMWCDVRYCNAMCLCKWGSKEVSKPVLMDARVCVCVCLCVCVHACMRACVYVCTWAYVHVDAACMYACVHVCVYACIHVCMHACMRICMCAGAHACMHAAYEGHATSKLLQCRDTACGGEVLHFMF